MKELIYEHPGLRTYRTDKGIYQHAHDGDGPEKYAVNLKGIHNAAAKLRLFEGSGFTPRLLGEWSDMILQEDLGISEGVEAWTPDDWQNLRRGLLRALIAMRSAGVRHGDFSRGNIVIRNKQPWVIDWQESHFLETEPAPQVNPLSDTYWLCEDMAGWASNPEVSDPYRVCRRWESIWQDMQTGEHPVKLGWQGRHLLDIGCFQGDFSAFAAAELMTVTGIDPGGFRSGEDSIEIARKLWPGLAGSLQFCRADVMTWPHFRYDAVLFLDTFPYVVQQHGRELATDLLRHMIGSAGRVYFETQMAGDNPPVPWLETDADVMALAPAAKWLKVASFPERGVDRTIWRVTWT